MPIHHYPRAGQGGTFARGGAQAGEDPRTRNAAPGAASALTEAHTMRTTAATLILTGRAMHALEARGGRRRALVS